MKTRRLGRNGPKLSLIGLGCMGMSDFYGPADRGESIATVHAALEAGVTLFDTGDFYGMGHNEMLLAEALADRREKAFIQVKFGALRDPSGGFGGFDARPAAIRNFLAYSLKRLKTDYIDLYMPARVDPNVPIEDVVGTIADLVKAGHVRNIGLSEAGADTLRRAQAVHPIAGLQIEYSLASRSLEAEVLPACRQLGVGLTAYGVLARGLLSGSFDAASANSPGSFRGRTPRFQGENLSRNLAFAAQLQALAAARGATAGQFAIAWALSRGDDILPLIGARRRPQLAQALAALDLSLTAEELAAMERAVPAAQFAGTRYDAHGMTMLDSEKKAAG